MGSEAARRMAAGDPEVAEGAHSGWSAAFLVWHDDNPT